MIETVVDDWVAVAVGAAEPVGVDVAAACGVGVAVAGAAVPDGVPVSDGVAVSDVVALGEGLAVGRCVALGVVPGTLAVALGEPDGSSDGEDDGESDGVEFGVAVFAATAGVGLLPPPPLHPATAATPPRNKNWRRSKLIFFVFRTSLVG